jgi:hypothetical protein
VDEVGAVDVDVCSLLVMVETLVVVDCVEGNQAMIVLGTDVDVVLVVIKALVVADELNKVLLDFGLVFDGDTRRGPSLVPAVVFFVVAVGLVVGSINSSMTLLMLWCSDWKLS